jgi:hypothetical protein
MLQCSNYLTEEALIEPPGLRNLEQTYQRMSDGELLRLSDESNTLTEEARAILHAELGKRGLEANPTHAEAEVSSPTGLSEYSRLAVAAVRSKAVRITAVSFFLIGGYWLAKGLAITFVSQWGHWLPYPTERDLRWVGLASTVARLGGYFPSRGDCLAWGAWALITGLGMFRYWSWARVSAILMGILAFRISCTDFLSSWVRPGGLMVQTLQLRIAFPGVQAGWLLVLGAGVLWWLIWFCGKSVSLRFRPLPFGPTMSCASARPVRISVAAGWLIAYWPAAFLLVRLHLGGSYAFPNVPFGIFLNDSQMSAYGLAVTMLGVALGFGLLQMKSWARAGTVALSAFWILSDVAFAVHPNIPAAIPLIEPLSAVSPAILWISSMWDAALPSAAILTLVPRMPGSRATPGSRPSDGA